VEGVAVVNVQLAGDVAQLRAVGKALREAADKEQKRELYKAVQRATKPIKEEIKQSAIDTLPKSGGLNVWASKIKIKTKQSYNGRCPGVTIAGAMNNKAAVSGRGRGRKKVRTFGKVARLDRLNAGMARHPVFGHGPLVLQPVTPGFWDRPLTGVTAQRAKREIRAAMEATLRAIAAKSRAA
jgi:hypothetical protein